MTKTPSRVGLPRRSGPVLALLAAGVVAGCIDTRTEYDFIEDSRPVDGIETLRLDVDLGVGRLDLSAGEAGGSLYALELNYDRLHYVPEIDFSASGTEATLRFDLESTGSFPIGDNDNDLRLTLAPGVLVDLDLSTGVGRSRIDLDDLQVSDLRFEGGVGQTEISFGTPMAVPMGAIDLESGVGEINVYGIGNSRVSDFRFEGGVGGASLNFSGDWGEGTTRVDVEVGIGELAITVPDDLVVEFETDDGLMTEVQAAGFRRTGNRYRRESDTGPVRVDMRIESGLGAIRIEPE